MTNYKNRDIVLVDFGFSEQTGSKKRPALVISSDGYHKKRGEVIVAAITSNIKRILFGDTRINQWKEAGLIYPSLVTGIIRTLKKDIVIRRLGTLPKQDFEKTQKNLKRSMSL